MVFKNKIWIFSGHFLKPNRTQLATDGNMKLELSDLLYKTKIIKELTIKNTKPESLSKYWNVLIKLNSTCRPWPFYRQFKWYFYIIHSNVQQIKNLLGGEGSFLVYNRCYKNQSLPSTSCHAKQIPKIGKVYFVKKIDMLNIFHMPPSEAM